MQTHSNQLRVAMDATVATKQLGGISEYTRNLLVGLAALSDQPEYFLLRFGYDQAALRDLPVLPPNFHDIHKRIPQKLLNFSWQTFGFPKVTRWLPETDLFFAPHFLVPPGDYNKLVITVHDVLFLDNPEWFLAEDVAAFTRRLGSALTRAGHVIAVSQTTKESLVKHQLVVADRITVIPSGVDLTPANPEEIARVRAIYQLPEKYLLYVGTIEPRKNILRQLEAYARLREAGIDQPFVLAGRRGWLGNELEETITRLGLEKHVILLGDFARADKAGIYGGASVFLFPSLAEGFGIPPLEAMAAGVPVVTSNVSSLPEVAGDAALLVDPHDTRAIAAAAQSIFDDPGLAERLRAAGRKRAAQYNWTTTAQATLEIFKKVAEGVRQ